MGHLDPTTGNLALGIGTYDPNMNGFISRGALAAAPSVQNTPMSLGELLLGLDTIQQGFHTVFQTNASLGDKVWAGGWAALAIASDVGLVASGAGWLVKGAAWAVDAVRVARLAKGADEAITAASDAEKLVTATNDAEQTITAADEAITAADQGAADLAGVCPGEGALSFSSDTLVATPSGERAIGSLKVGDQVTAYDPSTGKSSTQTVQHVWVNHDHDLLDVTLHADGLATQADAAPDKAHEVATKAHGSQAPPSPSDAPRDETIHTTEKHPWLTTDRGWVTAGDLRVGEHVVELGGRTATITALAVKPGAATYYNLTVSTLHTYAVGTSRAVVHNTNCFPPRSDEEIQRGTQQARDWAQGGNQFGTNFPAGAVAKRLGQENIISRGLPGVPGEVEAPFAPASRLSPWAGGGKINCAEGYCLLHLGEPTGPIDVFSWADKQPVCRTCLASYQNWADLYEQPVRAFHQIGNADPEYIDTFFPTQWGQFP